MLPSIFGERLFDEFFGDPFMPAFNRHDPLFGKNARNLMKTDVRESEKSYELDIDLPGFSKDEITVQLENGYLSISAAKGLDKDQENKDGKYIRRERYAGRIVMDLDIPEAISGAMGNHQWTAILDTAEQKDEFIHFVQETY